MNERIRQLLNEATVGLEPDLSTHTTITHNELSKFAELIVRECVEIADKSNQGSKSSNEGTEFYYNADIGDKIKEHFGIDCDSKNSKFGVE